MTGMYWGVGIALALGSTGCTYSELRPEAQAVAATTTRPAGNCKSLGILTGKGGGAGGIYVSNESLVEHSINDLRNQAATLGATHVVYSTPTMGETDGTTTSAMVTGEALACEADETPPAPAAPVAAKNAGGCEHDAQCKGDRVCVNHQCVDPAPSSKAGSTPAPVPPAAASVPAAAAPAPAPAAPAPPAPAPGSGAQGAKQR